MKIAAAIALALLAAPAAAQAPPVFAETLNVCRKAFIEAINGRQSSPRQIVESVEPEKRPLVALGCGFYFTGQADLLAVMRENGGTAI